MTQSGKDILEEMRRQTQQSIDNMQNRRPEVLQTLEENAKSRGADDPSEAALKDYYTILAQQRFNLQALDEAIESS